MVDDGSTDDTAAIAESSPLAVRLVRTGGVGPGPARNAGVAVATGEALAFTDADCVPAPGWLEAGLEALAGADLVQGAVHADPAAAAGPFDRTLWIVAETGLYECASLFCRRELFDHVGGFEDWLGARLGKPLAEDAWFGWRARRAGARTAFADAALVHHAVFARSAGGFVAERARLAYFPELARKMPELRGTTFFGPWFASKRSAAFDAALVATAIAARRRSPTPLIGAAPWACLVLGAARRWGRRAPGVAVAEAAADAVGAGALAIGSLRARTMLL